MSQYRAYPAYKDSGIEWIGQVPEEWKTGKLKHLGTLKGGSGFPTDMQGQPDNELPFYKVGDLSKSRDNISLNGSSNTISRKDAKELGATVFPENTISWAKIGAALFLNRRRISKTACCLDNNMTGFVVDSKKVPIQYAFYLMNAIDFSFFARPGAVPSLSEGEQSAIPIAIPSYEESFSIAATLDRETARIDALVEKKTRFIELLKEKRQALITHAVTKGLDPNAKMKDSGVEWIGQVPEHWKIAQIKRISVLNPKKSTLSEEKDSLCTFLPMEKLRTNTVTLDETRPIHEVYDGYSYFCDDDILIAKVTPCFENGNIAVANGLVNGIGFGSTEINVLRVNEKGHNRFLYYRLQEEQFRTIAKSEMRGTGGLKRVPTELFESFTIGLPDTDEQATIAATLDRETARIDALISKAEQSITLLKERRAAFITAAVTGQIDLRGKQ